MKVKSKVVTLSIVLQILLSSCAMPFLSQGSSSTASSMLSMSSPGADYKNGGYYYDKIGDAQKAIYRLMYDGLSTMGSEITIPLTYSGTEISNDDINYAYQSITFDHPEIFYTEGYQISKYEDCYKIYPSYSKTEEEIKSQTIKNIEYEKSAIGNIKTDDEYKKAKFIYEYIIKHTEYDIRTKDTSNICSIVNDGKGVCEGYAKMMMTLLNMEGIEAIVIPGYIKGSGTSHMWNAAKIDGEWYLIDPTWGDSKFNEGGESPEVRYDYFCVTDNMIDSSHVTDCFVALPKCISTKDNYFVKSNLVIDETYTKETIKNILSPVNNGETVSFLCKTSNIYDEIYGSLITRRKITNYIKNGKINYAINKDLKTMTFWTDNQP